MFAFVEVAESVLNKSINLNESWEIVWDQTSVWCMSKQSILWSKVM